MTRYRTIVADPPWITRTGPMSAGGMGEGFNGGATSSQPLSYETLTLAQMMALPVREFAEDDAHLYLWTTNNYLEAAFAVARAWGFEFSTLLTWSKKPMGSGLGGAWKISTEHVLFCRRGKDISHGWHRGTCFDYKRPYDDRGKPKHSAKPPQFLDDIEAVSPGPYLELFSRVTQARAGWDYHGDESLQTVELAS